MTFYVTPGINADHMLAKNDRLCTVQGPAVKMERDMAPLGDNQNPVIYAGDKVTFPFLFAGKGKPPMARPLPIFSKASGKGAKADSH
jgi:hypothetical protein